jgi:Ca2+-transporting ATPase
MLLNDTQGLSESEAQRRLREEGWNELPSSKPRSFLAIVWNVVREPMFLLLMTCGCIYLLLGSMQDAIILLGSVVVVMGASVLQERKSERALEALRDLSSPRALVMRDGEQKRISGREVVRGDIIFLAEGDRVAADAILLSVQGMSVDESLLTGESAPVSKAAVPDVAENAVMGKPGGDAQPFLFSGSMVVQGKGMARVVAVADRTAIGAIGRALFAQEEETSRVQVETAQAVKRIAMTSVFLVILLMLWYGATRGDWLNGVLAGLTLAMGIMPVEFPLVLVIFLALGAWRIAKMQVLTRRIPAIEMLGETTVLCVDKTGTLTQNRMTLAQVMVDAEAYVFVPDGKSNPADFPEKFHTTLEFAMLSSQRDPFDPMEKAIQQAGRFVLDGTEHIHDGWTLIEEYTLSPQLLAMSRVWQSPDLAQFVIAAKGAPEAVIDLCHLDQVQVQRITDQVNQMAEQGLRVLAVARASFTQGSLPPIQHDFVFEFLGLIGLADPLRPTVRAAVDECHAAGIRVVMITGDYPVTAHSIARQAGLTVDNGIITGAELDLLDDDGLLKRLHEVNIFCRVSPEQKLRLVNALKISGEIVAMTGDGVNDAPALKAAHIGIAMGERGTDVARESSALVLLNDDFSSIVAAIRLGRRIFDNIRKAVVFIVAAHIPIAGMSLIPVMMGWPLLLLPIHIVFFELMVDPTCTIVFESEPEDKDVMSRPPRPTDAKIFDIGILSLALRQGLALLAIMVVIYVSAQYAGLASEQARALTFTAMIIGDIWLIFVNRSWALPLWQSVRQHNASLWWVIAATLMTLGIGLFVPPVSALFHFGAVNGQLLGACALAVTVALALLSGLRIFRRPS